MNRIEAPQSAALGELSGPLRNFCGQLDHHEAPEVAIEGGNDARKGPSGHGPFPLPPRQGRKPIRWESS